MPKISPCLWFNDQAEEAVQFYSSVFKNSQIGAKAFYSEGAAKASGRAKNSLMTVDFTLENLHILALNGGPHFKFTPSMSLFVWCESEAEIDGLWKELAKGGEVRMGLDSYPWSKKYGWTADRFGVEWQLILAPNRQKIAPAFLFVDSLFGKGEEAINFYTSQFPNSKIETITRDEAAKSVVHCIFSLDGQDFVLMDGPGKHGHTPNEAFSLMVSCANQKEIDRYWDNLSKGGATSQCGWLKDKFGVSWQIIPDNLSQIMSDPKKGAKAMEAILKMTKIDIQKINEAAAQA